MKNPEVQNVFGKTELDLLNEFVLKGPYGTNFNPDVAVATR